MNCPVCGDTMREIEKFRVRIDICPGCKGVWLDRGELEKVVELSAAGASPELSEARGARPPDPSDYPRAETPHHGHRHPDQYQEHGRHKKRGVLGELFEIFD